MSLGGIEACAPTEVLAARDAFASVGQLKANLASSCECASAAVIGMVTQVRPVKAVGLRGGERAHSVAIVPILFSCQEFVYYEYGNTGILIRVLY